MTGFQTAMPPQTEFRDLLRQLDETRLLRHVSRPVDPMQELVAIVRKVQKGPNQPLLFKTVSGSPLRLRPMCCAAGLSSRTPWGFGWIPCCLTLIRKEGQTRPLETVSNAPVHEHVATRAIEIKNEIPQVVHCEEDKRVSAFGKIRDIGTHGHIFGCVVTLEKTSIDQARAVMLAALAAHPWMKVVIVVDADVDPHDPTEPLWAVHTRNTPETGIYTIPRLGSFQRADVRDAHRGKVGIDATAPMSMRDVFWRRKFPGMDAINLDEVLDPIRST
jgi:3-polyprenyl-4-hydroxybenzoate decarboxylase